MNLRTKSVLLFLVFGFALAACGKTPMKRITPLRVKCDNSVGGPCAGLTTDRQALVFLTKAVNCDIKIWQESKQEVGTAFIFTANDCTGTPCSKNVEALFSPANTSQPVHQVEEYNYNVCVNVDANGDSLTGGVGDTWAVQ